MNTVTEQDYQLLSRYIDRELPQSERQLLEQRLESEPSMASELARLQALQGTLQRAHRDLDKSVPDRVLALLQPRPTRIVPLPHRRVRGWGFALAASLMVAASATLITQWNQHQAPAGGASGVDAMLAGILENSPSRGTGWETLADGRNVRPVLSFRSHGGAWCREYLMTSGEGNWHAVACRGDEGWAAAVLSGTDLVGSPDDYRPAGAMDTDEVTDFIDRNATDIPLDAEQENALIARDWQ